MAEYRKNLHEGALIAIHYKNMPDFERALIDNCEQNGGYTSFDPDVVVEACIEASFFEPLITLIAVKKHNEGQEDPFFKHLKKAIIVQQYDTAMKLMAVGTDVTGHDNFCARLLWQRRHLEILNEVLNRGGTLDLDRLAFAREAIAGNNAKDLDDLFNFYGDLRGLQDLDFNDIALNKNARVVELCIEYTDCKAMLDPITVGQLFDRKKYDVLRVIASKSIALYEHEDIVKSYVQKAIDKNDIDFFTAFCVPPFTKDGNGKPVKQDQNWTVPLDIDLQATFFEATGQKKTSIAEILLQALSRQQRANTHEAYLQNIPDPTWEEEDDLGDESSPDPRDDDGTDMDIGPY